MIDAAAAGPFKTSILKGKRAEFLALKTPGGASGEKHASDIEALRVLRADHPAVQPREIAVHLGVDAAAAELALVGVDRLDLGVDRLADVDVGARLERHLHRPAHRRVVGEEIEEP